MRRPLKNWYQRILPWAVILTVSQMALGYLAQLGHGTYHFKWLETIALFLFINIFGLLMSKPK
ncbi:hypothetical protein [Streptococcus halichoeri]|uniref:hypothetical protein n=1 Tax=Streptococcus halichoeri TaxID=254785 RepID=UPI0013597648|nr:hypothetical protein [Streptococcus halichoeri]